MHTPSLFLNAQAPHGYVATPDCTKGDPLICEYRYPFRHASARAWYDAKLNRLKTECDVLRSAQKDAPVNHPDTSEAWVFTYDTYTVRLSYKDKSALGKTIVTFERRKR